MKYLFVPVLAALLSGCVNDDLPKSYLLESFRVLALIADQPEVDPGAAVTITPLISDLAGDGRAIRFSATGCVDPGVGFGAKPTCDGNPTRVVLADDQPVTGIDGPEYTALATTTLTVNVPPATVIFADRSAVEKFNGVGYLVTFAFTAGDETHAAFRTIAVSTRPVKNQNPAYAANGLFAKGGAAVTALPQKPVEIFVKTAAAENYEEQDADGTARTKTETIETFWYLSDEGDLAQVITEGRTPTEYTPPETVPGGRDVLIVAVTRDARGGQSALVFGF